jgi:hypothetical protein
MRSDRNVVDLRLDITICRKKKNSSVGVAEKRQLKEVHFVVFMTG